MLFHHGHCRRQHWSNNCDNYDFELAIPSVINNFVIAFVISGKVQFDNQYGCQWNQDDICAYYARTQETTTKKVSVTHLVFTKLWFRTFENDVSCCVSSPTIMTGKCVFFLNEISSKMFLMHHLIVEIFYRNILKSKHFLKSDISCGLIWN